MRSCICRQPIRISFAGRAKFPKFKNRKARQAYTTNMVNGNIQLSDGHIKLPKLQPLKLKQQREIPAHHTIKSCTISRTASGTYEISMKTCSNCGHVNDVALSERTYSCDCGFVSDRDWNAAINIRNEGLLMLGLS